MNKKEHLYKRFGMIAVEKGFATTKEIIDALAIQIEEEQSEGMHRYIGQILLESGTMDAPQLLEVLETMSKTDGE